MFFRNTHLILIICLIWLLQFTSACPTGCLCTPTGFGIRAFCRGGSLTEILASLTENVHQLHVEDAVSLRVLKQSDFSHVRRFPLTKIFLTKCSIQEIQASVFSELPSLAEISLSDNNINIISNEAFSGLDKLLRLDLSKNRISDLGSILAPLKRLSHLDLSNNLLNNLQEGSFLPLSNLVRLKLDGNQLQTVKGEVFRGLRNLDVLSLRNCDLMSIDSSIFNEIVSLSKLDLGKNRISSLPPSHEFKKLYSLRHLYLEHNELTKLEDRQFSKLSLNELRLSTNRISKLTAFTFHMLEVQKLDISYNVIYETDENFLPPTIEDLNIAGNPLRALHEDAFKNLNRLYNLNLSSCGLQALTENQFRDLHSLLYLDLSHNSLQYLPASSIRVLDRLQTLKIQNNVWHCDCHIKPLKTWLQDPKSTDIIYCDREEPLYSHSCKSLRCNTPSNFYNRRILSLQNTDIEKCQKKEKSSLSVNTQIIIVVSCIAVSLILLTIAICLWRRDRTKEELKKVCVPVEQESSHLDFEKKPKPFENSEIRSLNESDRSFVFRNYFQTMVTNPSRTSYPSISQRDVDSVYSSQPSLYSSCSRVPQETVGIESTV